MKMREIILRAIARKITWDQAADILGMSPPAMLRLRNLYEKRGYDGFWVRAAQKSPLPQIPFAVLEKVLLLYQDKYSRLDVRAFHEQLRKRHSIRLSYPWLAQTLREAGLVPSAPAPGHEPSHEVRYHAHHN